MKHIFVGRFENQLDVLSKDIQKKFNKQLRYLLSDIRHPSLRAKKREELGDVWQARVDDNYRFYFQIRGDTYFIIDILRHSK